MGEFPTQVVATAASCVAESLRVSERVWGPPWLEKVVEVLVGATTASDRAKRQGEEGQIMECRRLLRSTVRAATSVLVLGAGLATSQVASAKPGTHPVTVSTWDTRASSVLLQYRHGFVSDGGLNSFSYEANFSSTSGKLSAQFGIHYQNYDEAGDDPTQHGMSGSAVALFNFPVARRYENGLARAGVAFYVGAVPTALISGERNYLSIPFVLGFGVPISPARAVSITPWFEFSPGVNLDTVIKDFSFENEDPDDYINLETNTIELDQGDIERVLRESVELDFSFKVGARAGLDLALHASDAFDFTANATLSSIGTAFSGERVIYVGGGLVFRWDDVVPAVLPPEKRLLNESCDDVETRFRSCPNRQRWKSPEELQVAPPPPAVPPLPPSEPAPAPALPPPTVQPAEPQPAPPADAPVAPPTGNSVPGASFPAPPP